uniref:Actin-related protein 6 n=1 Tax=Photinus pyralis TaxID=7054 RepID=A0A1Y1K9S5_PHOPY
MSLSKGDEIPEKRLKIERTYSNRSRSDKTRSRRPTTEELSPSTSKTNKEKYAGPPILILDNGAYTAKIGVSSDESAKIIPNCIMKVKSERKRFFIGNQIEECRDLSGLYYLLPCEKGFTVKWTVQKPVWDYMFNNVSHIEDKGVIMTQPIFNFKTIQEITDEIFFEEYEIKSMFRVNPCDLAKYEYVNRVAGKNVPCIVVDSGFSYTTVVPYIDGKKYYPATRRINVGGKMLTNYLKEIISYRQLHVMDETYVINQVKEDSCYVSSNFKEDMRIAGLHGDANSIVKSYVLPDFNNIRRGYVQESKGAADHIAEGCQILRLNNERFTVPELLFHPSDIGIESVGIAECIVKCIHACPEKERPHLAKHIVLMGGNCNFPGFKERVYFDLRSYLPDHWTVNVHKPENPITFAWQGGKSLSADPKLKSLFVTKEQYEERGTAFTYERFSDWLHAEKTCNEENPSPTIETVPSSILNKSNLTRFDLFGKHEVESEELSESLNANSTDKLSKETTSDSKTDGADNSKDNDSSESSIVGRDIDVHQDDDSNKAKFKSSLFLETNENDSFDTHCFSSYDFNIFSNSFV